MGNADFNELAGLLNVRPMDPDRDWPGPHTEERQRSRFEAEWADTVHLLNREIDHLRTGNERSVLQVAVTEAQIRNDGLPRADAKIGFPGVILRIPSEYGELTYPCDTFYAGRYARSASGESWQHNLRAIALGLEALRRVERYGIAQRGQQYAGWKALPMPGESAGADPITVLCKVAGVDEEKWRELIEKDPTRTSRLVREARRKAHPDAGGTTSLFNGVQIAAKQLGVG